MHIGEPELSPLKPIGQFLVIESKTVKDRRLQVMNVNRILDNVE